MRAILLMFDSLNRHLLSAYGGDPALTPNFRRLAERTVTFDRAYVASMPCMPARRELHTGRYNFLHRGWGGLEATDASMPALLDAAGVHTHICTDHYHYWEDGGSHYLQRYQTCEMIRGQEGDGWIGQVRPPDLAHVHPSRREGRNEKQDEINRGALRREEDWPVARTVSAGLEFIERNRAEDGWFLQIETFDPHEPFCAPERLREKVGASAYRGLRVDWPPYGRVAAHGVRPEEVEQMRKEYLALLAFCDEQLGRVLDAMDAGDLWRDTMLIVNTDHGFLLGERGLLAKCVVPFYEEVSHIPLFVWDPRSGRRGERRGSLVQTIDLPATVLEYFGCEVPATMQGRPLRGVIEADRPVRDAGLFGLHGGMMNIVNARGEVLMVGPDESVPLYDYTLDCSHMRSMYGPEALRQAELAPPFGFTGGSPVLRVPGGVWRLEQGYFPAKEMYDLAADPGQAHPLEDPGRESRLRARMAELMREGEAPAELFARYGLTPPAS